LSAVAVADGQPTQALYGGDGLPFELLLRSVLSRRPHRPALLNVMGCARKGATIFMLLQT
jgi:hypothetical protein